MADKDPDYCGNCHAAAKEENGKPVCCNSCSAVFAAYEANSIPIPDLSSIPQCVEEGWAEKIKEHTKEGCRVAGWFKVNKVSGNFHFAPGHSYDARNYHLHDMRFLDGIELDFGHKINYLAFGEHHEKLVNPLDGYDMLGGGGDSGDPKHASSGGVVVKGEDGREGSKNLTFSYYIKVVASDFVGRSGRTLHTNQYAVTQNEHQISKSKMNMPSKQINDCFLYALGAFFYYDISPMIVIYTEYKKSLASFLTGVCAVIGGVYTIAAILDAIVFHAERRLIQKRSLGKTF